MRREACTSRRLTPTRHTARVGASVSRVHLLFALLALFALAPAVNAQTSVYHIRGNATAGSNNIWAINPATGAETLVYTGYPGGNAATLAQRPSDGMIFYVINDPSGQNGAVYRFNPATPSVAPVLLGNIGPSTSGGNVLSGFRMAFNNAGTLYYMSGGGGADNDTLYTVNQATGRATSVATITGTGSGGDMAFNGATLYIMNQNRQLYSATVAGGAATSIGTVTFPGGATPGTIGLGVDGTRILITTSTTASNLYAITLPSLAASSVGALSGGTTATGDLSTTVITAPSITVTKTDGVTNTYQGASLTYTVVVTNSGTYTVTATVADTIPAGLTGATWTCVASPGSSCAAASGSGNIATSATLEAGDTATYTISATVTASSGTIANTVTANPPAWITDASPANNTATDTDNVIAAADLSITKTTASTFTVGSNAVYTLTATNSGPQSAAGTITISDTLPTGLTYVSATGTGWACGAAGQVVTCTRAGPVTSGTTLPAVTLTVAVGAAAAPSVTNTATVASNTTFDPDATDNSSSVTKPVTIPTDLTIAKSHTGNFTQGQNGSYSITVTNSGGVASSGTVTVTDTLPAGLTPGAATGTGWTCNTAGQTVTCTRSDALAGGGSYPVINVPVTVAPNSSLSLTNTATVSGGGDSNVGNNTSSDPTTINGVPDLTIVKTHAGNFTQGQNGTYTITATNSGGAATSGTITISDTLPAGLTYVSATGTGWTCGAAGQVVTCTRSDALAAGASYPAITLTISVAPNSALSLTNTATVSGGGQTNTSNDSSSNPTTVNGVADVTIAKTHTGNFTRGSTGSYTLTVSNAGGAATSGTVTVTDTLPTGLSYVVATGTGWTCGAVGQVVTCTRSDALAAGASYPAITLVANVLQTAASSVTNTGAVSGGGQTNTANDSSSDPTNIVSSSDLSLSKSVNNPSPVQGQNVTFTLTLINAGPSNATNVAVKDLLPAGLTFVSATPSAGTYTSGTGVWSVASLTSGASATLQIVALVSNAGAITNTAEVTASDQPDPDSTPNNNNAAEDDQASASIGAAAPPSIGLVKSVTPSGTQVPGTDLTYTIAFSNAGGYPASAFVLTDPDPATVLKINDYMDFKVGSVVNSLGTTGLTVAVAYSNNNGATWTYTPASGAGGAPVGYDRNVTHIRWSFVGSLSQASPNNAGSVSFTSRIR
ncbi:MAG: beta strand repeat-containing protein [Pyrinomonadaceae bacterium]